MVVLIALVATHTSADGSDFRLAGYLAVLAIIFEEGVRRAAQLKLRLSAELKRDMTSVWTVATAVVLPPVLAIAVTAVLASYIWLRQHRPTGHPFYIGVFNIALLALSAGSAGLAVHAWSPAWGSLPWALDMTLTVLLAMATNTVVNRSLASVGLLLNGVPVRDLRGTREDNLMEVATLCLGGLVAVAALNAPWLCVLALAPMVTLQRGALVSELETAASVDAKTGLLNAVAWEHLAHRELTRAARENYDVAVLIIDIDRFKLVNDRFGHLIGDRVLHRVGRLLAAEVREYDTVGRFGGEEFVAVLPQAGDADALVVAERIRSRVHELRMSALLDTEMPAGVADTNLAVSIGVACSRSDGAEVSSLLVAADAALYRAKSGGRNRVVLADRGTGPVRNTIIAG
ncbi:MAG TPA: GGDEF domain-containing protein [Jatrophihabitans sp.]|nr:GGDEF domain-containing protein [Jatrophihabitans sp.]